MRDAELRIADGGDDCPVLLHGARLHGARRQLRAPASGDDDIRILIVNNVILRSGCMLIVIIGILQPKNSHDPRTHEQSDCMHCRCRMIGNLNTAFRILHVVTQHQPRVTACRTVGFLGNFPNRL